MITVKQIRAILEKLPDEAEFTVEVSKEMEGAAPIKHIELIESNLLFGSETANVHRQNHYEVRITV